MMLTKMNFTDVRLLTLREEKPKSKEYSASIQQLEISSDNSRKALDFFARHDDGFFLPEKCDAYEPIREKFEPNNLNAPIRWLSQPGGAVYLKKIKPFKYEGVLENNCLAMVWDENGNPLSSNKEAYSKRDPYYLGELKLFIEKRIIELKSEDYLFKFFNDLSELINMEYGYIKDYNDQIILENGKLINP